MNFWRSYFLPSHYKALSRIKTMDRMTFRPLLGAWLGSFVALEGMGFIIDSSVADPRTRMIFIMMFTGVFTYVMTVYSYLLLPRRTQEAETNVRLSPIKSIWKDSGMDLIAEMLCVAALMLFWAIFGIIPGLFKGLRWAFVPYIATTDANYRAGEVHARDYSNRLMKGITWALALIWAAYFGLDVLNTWAESFSGDMNSALLAFAWRLGLSMVSFYLLIYSVLLDFGIYQLRTARSGE